MPAPRKQPALDPLDRITEEGWDVILAFLERVLARKKQMDAAQQTTQGKAAARPSP